MEKKDWEQRLEDFYFEREKILPSQSVGIDIDDWKEFISQELDKAREEVERKFVEKYHKRGKEMNAPYSEEDGKEFWQGYKEGYNQGLKDMIVDTYYLDKEFELKLKQ